MNLSSASQYAINMADREPPQFKSKPEPLKEGRNRLGMAAERGEYRKVEEFIAAGDDPNQSDAYSETPLYLAAGAGALNIVKLLMELHGADTHHRNWDGWTP